MSVAEQAEHTAIERPVTRTALAGEDQWLSGWGRAGRSRARVLRPRVAEEVVEFFSSGVRPGKGVIARGAGRNYGDAAQNGGGDVLDMTAMDRIVSIDGSRALVTAQAGTTVGQLMARLAAHGLTLPVVPGTRHVTLAGAIASDIHGKNHHRDGGIARHVRSLSICTPAGGLVEVSPESDPGLFYATLGGMGLTGVVLEATIAAQRLDSPWVAADVDRTGSLAETLELMAAEERHRYSVAWLDMLAQGSSMGRAVISQADPLPADAVGPRTRGRRAAPSEYPAALLREPAVDVPRGFPAGLLRPATVRAFNALNWGASPRRERGRALAMTPYFFPLDVLGEWNRLYGPAGLLQYQFVIPSGQEHALERCFELMRSRRLPVYLAVFKRFGPAFGGPLSFPLEGWTLAADLPAAAPGLGPTLDELDELVAGAGGRVYLTKDARLRRELLPAMYPQLDRFHAERSRADPEGVMRSDLGRRLGLCEGERVSSGHAVPQGEGTTTAEHAGSSGARVLVLGGTSEIALAIVRELQRRAPREVVLAGRDMKALEAAAEQLREAGCGRVAIAELDALQTDRHEEAVGQAFAELDGADIVILAVGVLGERGGLPADTAGATEVLQVNLVGAGSLLIHAARRLREEGGGALVVLSSVAAERPRRANAVYGASKAGLDALARGIGDDLHDDSVRVLVARPGFVRTRMTEGLDPAPLSTDPETVARTVVDGLDKGSRVVWAPPALRWLMLVVRMLPGPIFRQMKQ
jgi:decaprenylphospho-beta-D-ribofuranose 2-oxidase